MKEKRNDKLSQLHLNRERNFCLEIPIRYLYQQDVLVQMANQERQLDLIEKEQKKNIKKIMVQAVDRNDVN